MLTPAGLLVNSSSPPQSLVTGGSSESDAPVLMLGESLRPRTRGASQERSMLTHARAQVYSKDEELGKRDDDFKPKRSSTASSLLRPWRWRKRRMFAVVALLLLGSVFVRNLPEGLGLVEERLKVPVDIFGSAGKPAGGHVEPTGPPPRLRTREDEELESTHYYDGPIKFYRLASSLHAIARTMGTRQSNRNVLFAVSSLQSAANLMPMACEMAKWDRNYVHVAFLGRDSLSVGEILEVNGVSRETCTAYFHDARGDYSEYSTEKRAEVAVSGAMKHINDFMHPQVMIMDDSVLEDAFFVRAMRYKAVEMGRALIEIPADRYEEFLWLTRLDSGSLRNWFKPTIDILIHGLPDSSGGLVRLVKSLEDADYAGFAVPKLTIELPPDIDHFAKNYLERLQWPRNSNSDPWKPSTLALHHRIPASQTSSEEASVRFVESFYPPSSADNHVLVLSPQAEISPTYLQYLHYVILEYRYSSYGSPEADSLLGVSLDVPANLLNGTDDFVPPLVRDMREQNAQRYLNEPEASQLGPTPFLYQAPTATASLIFGDKWATLHSFLSNRLTASHCGVAQKTKKLVSETEPAWVEYLLELMRARGWSMLYPAAPFVTIHNELSQVPEEFLRSHGDQETTETPVDTEPLRGQPFLLAAEPPVIQEHIERETPQAQSLQDILPFDADLPELMHLPYMLYTGELFNSTVDEDPTEKYAALFRRRIGGCQGKDATRKRVVSDVRLTDDLFCLPGIEIEFDNFAEEDEEQVAQDVIAETAGSEGVAEVSSVDGVQAAVDEVPEGAEEDPADENDGVGDR